MTRIHYVSSSSSGAASTVLLPEVLRADQLDYSSFPGDKVILDADCGGTCSGFLIVDLKKAKVIEDIGAEDVTISPDGRFISDKWIPHLVGGEHENLYHLYDTTETPMRECSAATCQSAPSLRDSRGLAHDSKYFRRSQVQIFCTNKENDGLDDGQHGNELHLGHDSSKIVFADVRVLLLYSPCALP